MVVHVGGQRFPRRHENEENENLGAREIRQYKW